MLRGGCAALVGVIVVGAARAPKPTRIVIAPHKSGSTFVYRLLKRSFGEKRVRLAENDVEAIGWFDDMCDTTDVFFSRTLHVSPTGFTKHMRNLAENGSCAVMLHTRHPIDVVVSAFNSFTTLNHAIVASTEEEREEIVRRRKEQHELGVDRWALEHAQRLFNNLEVILEVSRLIDSDRVEGWPGCTLWMSKYEDMVVHPLKWMAEFIEHVPDIPAESIDVLYQSARNERNITPNEGSHTAYVYPGAHRRVLRGNTTSILLDMIDTEFPFIVNESGYF